MSSDSGETSENICVVCFKNVDIYSVGNCDHMVCYECSTRMRVLCRQNECPICRQDLPKVIFSKSLKPFSEIVHSAAYEDKKYKIYFQDRKIQDAFYKLMEHCCSICPNRSFKTFQNLSDHMRREHELYYCDLCVENLKIFTSERRCYSKTNLSHHRREGDPDDRSHRGHPLCEFCQIRFMDKDFLYRHLRKDHLFCHFCDADGDDSYYSSYGDLHDHFRKEHYLCEEGTCMEEKFTPVFRTEIDLKAHRMTVHGRTMGKAAAKQARTLELEFTLKPRPRQQESSRKGKPLDVGSEAEGAAGFSEEPSPKSHSPTSDPSEFPCLPSGSGAVTVSSAPQRRARTGALTIQAVGRRNTPLAITYENFPALGEHNDSSQGASVRLNINQDRSNSSGGSGTATPRNVSIHVNHRPNREQNITIRQCTLPGASTYDKNKLSQDDEINKDANSIDKSAFIADGKVNAPPEATTIELLSFQAKNLNPGAEGAQSSKEEAKVKPLSVKKPPYTGKDSKDSLVDENLKKKTDRGPSTSDAPPGRGTRAPRTRGNPAPDPGWTGDRPGPRGKVRPKGGGNAEVPTTVGSDANKFFPPLTSDSSASSIPAAKWVSVPNKKQNSTPVPKKEKQAKPPLLDGDFPALNSKVNTNLNLKSNEPLKPNYVTIRNSKGDGKSTKKASSVLIPVREDGLDLSEASTSSSKAKVKKKKSKGNVNQERSDTAKKKDDKEVNNLSRGTSDSAKNNSSAFLENSASNTKLVKPLPTAEDWFGDRKKIKSKSEGEDKEISVYHKPNRNSELASDKEATKLDLRKVENSSEVKGSSTNSTSLNRQDSIAPPGFDQLNGLPKNKDSSKPPPGFALDFPRSNGLTFTNSGGQSFAIPTNYNYMPPLNFEKRNKNLTTKVFHILSNDSNLEQFKKMSALFRQDLLSADDYCNHCIKSMGEDGFREVFSELLVLLPDINKQQELFQVFSRSPKFEVGKTQLQKCETCHQVLCNSDLKEHTAQHTLQENFPLLMPNNWT